MNGKSQNSGQSAGEPKISSLVRKIASRIENDLDELASEGNNRLPSRTTLAAHYEVSRVTVQSALNYLNQRGKIRFGAGTKIFRNVSKEPSENELMTSLNLQESTKKVYFWLRDSILSGHFKKGQPLPKQQYLQSRFRMSGRTLRIVAYQLERDKLVYRLGRQWVVGQYSSSKPPYSSITSRAVIIVITPTWHSWLFQGRSEFSEKFCRSFEEQAMLQEIRLEQYGWRKTGCLV